MANSVFDNTMKEIKDKSARVCIIGLGYVGLPLAIECLNAGYRVDGYDILESKIDLLNRGESDVLDVPAEMVKKYIDNGMFVASSDSKIIADSRIILICVPTPLSQTREPDISYIEAALSTIKPHMNKGSLVVLESTTYPGTTEEVIVPTLEDAGFTHGKDLYVAFSPERVDPGNPKYQTHNTPKVVGADSKEALDIAEAFYNEVLESVVPVSSAKSAEMVKLLENTFRSVNIALVNELAQMCEILEIDVWEVVRAASSKPFGFMPFYPGPGVGGHCIPIDPHYLSWKMKSYNYFSRFIELAGDINANMPRFVVNQLMEFLNSRGKCLKDSKVLMLGMAYKNDISDVRESPALDLLRFIEQKRAVVDFYDPYVEKIIWKDEEKKSIELSAETLKKYDCVVVATAHKNIDYNMVYEHSKLIYDTRNAYLNFDDKDDKIELLGT